MTAGFATDVDLSNRDMAILRAVQAGRCELIDVNGQLVLMCDGLPFCDQLCAERFIRAGLVAKAKPDRDRPVAALTSAGRALLEAA